MRVRRKALTLVAARKAKGLTQRDMARMLGVTTSAYGLYEMGARKPDIAAAVSISRLLEQPIEVLFAELIDNRALDRCGEDQKEVDSLEVLHTST